MVEKFEQNDELKRSFEINSVQSDEAIEIVSDEDKKEDPEPLIKVEAPSQLLQTNFQEVAVDQNVKFSEISESDKQKIDYLQQLDTASYGPQYKENLLNLMNMGFFNFSYNLEMLQRNFNNLEIVCAKLFEGNQA